MNAVAPTGAGGPAGWRGAAVLAVWTAALVAVLRLLLAVRPRSLAVPLTSLGELSAWASDTPPSHMAVGVLRLGAIAAAVYLLAVTVLGAGARLLRLRAAADLLASISPGAVRRVVTRGSGLGLVVGGVVGGLPAPSLPAPASSAVTAVPVPATAPSPAAEPEGRSRATMTQLHDDPTDAAVGFATMVRLPPDAAGPRTTSIPPTGPPIAGRPDPTGQPDAIERADPTGQPDTIERPRSPRRDPAAPSPPAPPPTPTIDPELWVVEPGDSFWSIALEVTAAPDGSPADDRSVTRCWRRLVELNRSRLADPDNPDLLVPGQRLAVPPPDG